MPLRPDDLSSDPAHLTEMLLAFEAENAPLRATIIQLKSMIFGSRSKKNVALIAEQLPFDLDDHTQGTAAEPLTFEPANDDQSNKGCSPDKPEKKRTRIIGEADAILRLDGRNDYVGIGAIDGLIAAVVAGPAALEPAVWLPEVFGKTALQTPGTPQRRLMRTVLRRHDEVREILAQRLHAYLPVFMRDQGQTFTEDWTIGFMASACAPKHGQGF